MGKLNIRPEVRRTAVKYTAALVVTFILGGILIQAQGENALHAYKLILSGGLGSIAKIGNSIRWSIPILLSGAAATVAFRSGIFNMGIEGQLYMGAFTGGIVGAYISLPHVPHVLLCLLAGGLAGMLFALIPAVLKLFFNVNVVITTLMMNFIATQLTEYLTLAVVMGGSMSASGSAAITTPQILETATLTNIIPTTAANTGIFISLGVILLIAFAYKHTIAGYEMKQIGQNMRFAETGGVNVVKRFFAVFMISGFLAGMCGAMEVSGAYHMFVAGFSRNIGWEAIMVTRVAESNPIALLLVSLIWGILKAGSMAMERVTSLNRLTVNIIQMIFVLFVAIDYDGLLQSLYKAFRKKPLHLPKQEEAGRTDA